MDTQITLNENKDIVYSSFKLQKVGISAIGNPSFEQWEELGEFINKSEGAVHWWIGDWLNYGEAKWGEMYAQAMDQTKFDYDTLKKDKWVSEKIELCRRRHNLSYGHHQEVAKLDEETQDDLLNQAEEKNWSVQELRSVVKELNLDKKIDDIDDRKITPYGDNIYFLSTKMQLSRNDSYHIIKENETFPTLKRRSWFFHEDMREFSLREYAQVQEFPDSFKFVGTYEKIKDQIGNAVSPTMAKFVGKRLEGKIIGDIFAGCGGLSCGLEMLGKKAIWAIERNVNYARTYKVNHPGASVYTRDIKKVDPSTLPKVDIIVGGPPCQGFSLSGIHFKDDPRNQLYKEFVRFVETLLPEEFLLENVPQIETMKDEIIKDFENLGYKVETLLVKGEDIGMRQHRHRFFFIGVYGNNT